MAAAASGLDHLKNDYRARFCRPSRAPDIHRKKGQNMLEVLQDCFEEKSLITDLITNSTASLVCSTPKVKDCIQSPSKCQSSLPKSVPVSCRTKAASLQGLAPDRTTSTSVRVSEVHQNILTNDVSCKDTPKSASSLKRRSGEKRGSRQEADDECYLSVVSPAARHATAPPPQSAAPSDAQRTEACSFIRSVNTRSSSTEVSFKTRKRLDFEDKNTSNKEVKKNISEGQEGSSPKMPQRRGQDLEYEIQPQTKKSFSTLFLETVERKSQLSPVVRHTAVAPRLPFPPSTVNLADDEFIIDKSDRSFVSQPWVTIPRKGKHSKHHVAPSADESATVLQDRKSGGKDHTVSCRTLTGNPDVHQAQSVERSQPSSKKRGTSCALTDEVENNSRSPECEVYSKNTTSSSGNKRTAKQKPRRTLTADVVEEQLSTGQCKDREMPSIAQDNSQRNSERGVDGCEEMKNDPVSQEVPPVGKKKRKSSINKDAEESREKHLPSGSGSRFVPKDVTLTVNRSHRISRRPSDWWVVKPEGSIIDGNSSIRNELPVCHKNRQKSQKPAKPTKKRNHLSKNAGGRRVPPERQKAATRRSSRVQKSVKVKRSRRTTVGHEEHSSSQCGPPDSDTADLAPKDSLCCPGAEGQCKDQNSVVRAQSVHLQSQTSECATKMPTEPNSYSGESKISILEVSGPSRLKNFVVSGKSTSDMEEEDVQEYLDNSRKKQPEESPDRRMHPKIVFPSNTPNVRRTKRIRLKPLEYWRGERVDYQERPSGGFVIHGVLSPAPVPYKRKAKGNTGKVNKKVNAKSICPDNHERSDKLALNLDIPLGDPLQPTRVKDPETSTFIPMDLIRPRDTYKFFIELDELKVYKTLDTPFFSTGKLVLGPLEEKGRQYVGPDILIFYVSFGDLLCTLHETPYLIATGDSFYVPSGNYYNIRNLRNEESVLLFTQIKR